MIIGLTEEPQAQQVKTCSRCEESKPFSEFYKRADLAFGLSLYCKKCIKEMNLGRRAKAVAPEEKKCLRCGQLKPLGEFYNSAASKDGKGIWCKSCDNSNHTLYAGARRSQYREDPEFRNEIQKRREEVRAQSTTQSKECRRCKQVKPFEEFYIRMEFKDGLFSYCKSCCIGLASDWTAGNPGKSTEIHVRANRKRRALLSEVEYDETINIVDLYIRDGGICGICNMECEIQDATIDHEVPISLKGPHIWDNIQLAHRSCNSRKGAQVPENLELREYGL
jgi:5-methylcytosine-specific restriction endonuclease McrA